MYLHLHALIASKLRSYVGTYFGQFNLDASDVDSVIGICDKKETKTLLLKYLF